MAYSPVHGSFANLSPAKLLVMIVVSLVHLVPDRSKIPLVWLEEPSCSHVVGDPEKGDRTEY